MEEGYRARTQLTQNPGLFYTVQKKTNEANKKAKDRFLRTLSVNPISFLKINIYGQMFLATYPDTVLLGHPKI